MADTKNSAKRADKPTTVAAAAEDYRLLQAKELLKAAGYIERPDGNWARPETDAAKD